MRLKKTKPNYQGHQMSKWGRTIFTTANRLITASFSQYQRRMRDRLIILDICMNQAER